MPVASPFSTGGGFSIETYQQTTTVFFGLYGIIEEGAELLPRELWTFGN